MQACHASIAAGRDLITAKCPSLVLVTIPNQSKLIELSTKLTAAGVEHRVFTEDDMGGRPTALATRCIVRLAERRLFARLPLMRGSSSVKEHVA